MLQALSDFTPYLFSLKGDSCNGLQLKIVNDVPVVQTVAVEHSGSDDLHLYTIALNMDMVHERPVVMRCYAGPTTSNFIIQNVIQTLLCGAAFYTE